jgi:hypothetical protein
MCKKRTGRTSACSSRGYACLGATERRDLCTLVMHEFRHEWAPR